MISLSEKKLMMFVSHNFFERAKINKSLFQGLFIKVSKRGEIKLMQTEEKKRKFKKREKIPKLKG
jgi:hypothetical protein